MMPRASSLALLKEHHKRTNNFSVLSTKSLPRTDSRKLVIWRRTGQMEVSPVIWRVFIFFAFSLIHAAFQYSVRRDLQPEVVDGWERGCKSCQLEQDQCSRLLQLLPVIIHPHRQHNAGTCARKEECSLEGHSLSAWMHSGNSVWSLPWCDDSQWNWKSDGVSGNVRPTGQGGPDDWWIVEQIWWAWIKTITESAISWRSFERWTNARRAWAILQEKAVDEEGLHSWEWY